MVNEYPCAVPYDAETRHRWTELIVPREEYTERLARVRSAMQENSFDALLVVGNSEDAASVAYLANYNPHFGTTMLLIPLDGEPVVVSDAILHGEPMHSMLWDVIFDDLRPASHSGPPGSIPGLLTEAIQEKGLVSSRIAVASPTNLSIAHGFALSDALPDVEWQDGSMVMFRARSIKSAREIDYFRRASAITRAGLENGEAACLPGVTEREVANVIHSTMMDAGAEHLGFDTAVSSGERAGLKHAAPTDKVLEEGDLVFLDTGSVVGGYHADLSRTLGVGAIDSDKQAMLDASVDMFRASLKVIKPGAPVRDIYRAAERVARRSGFIADYMPNGLGHGLGLSLFEMPFLGPNDESTLEPCMIFALEPMLVRYAVGTAVVEESVLVTEDGVEILSGASW